MDDEKCSICGGHTWFQCSINDTSSSDCLPPFIWEPLLDTILFRGFGYFWCTLPLIYVCFNIYIALYGTLRHSRHLVENKTFLRQSLTTIRRGLNISNYKHSLICQSLLLIGIVCRSISFLTDPWGDYQEWYGVQTYPRIVIDAAFRTYQIIIMINYAQFPLVWLKILLPKGDASFPQIERFIYLTSLSVGIIILTLDCAGFRLTSHYILLAWALIISIASGINARRLVRRLHRTINSDGSHILASIAPSEADKNAQVLLQLQVRSSKGPCVRFLKSGASLFILPLAQMPGPNTTNPVSSSPLKSPRRVSVGNANQQKSQDRDVKFTLASMKMIIFQNIYICIFCVCSIATTALIVYFGKYGPKHFYTACFIFHSLEVVAVFQQATSLKPRLIAIPSHRKEVAGEGTGRRGGTKVVINQGARKNFSNPSSTHGGTTSAILSDEALAEE